MFEEIDFPMDAVGDEIAGWMERTVSRDEFFEFSISNPTSVAVISDETMFARFIVFSTSHGFQDF